MKVPKLRTGFLYGWGNSQMHQLAGARSHLKKPTLLSKTQSAHKIGCGEFNVIVSFKNAENYSIHGFGEFRGLPAEEHDHTQLMERTLELPGSSSPVTQIACGQQHYMILLEESGELFTWGSGHEGQLGHEDMDPQRDPKRVLYFKDIPLKSISAGWLNSFAISQVGDLYAWGSNHFSQLGNNNMFPENTPVKVEALDGRKVNLVAAGLFHSLVHTDSQELIAFGRIGKKARSPIHMDLNSDFKDDKIIQIGCGLYHNLILTESGKLYSFGGNEEGQLGIGSFEFIPRPQLIEHFQDYKVKHISCGPHHNLAVTQDKDNNTELWAWGLGQDWQLGSEIRQSETLPIKIPPFRNVGILEMALGYGHTVVVTESEIPNTEST